MTENSIATTYKIAKKYLEKKWYLFPCFGMNPDGTCQCGKDNCESPGKHPSCMSGVKAATNDAEAIRCWFDNDINRNLAIACGPMSNLTVIDVDGPEGSKSLDELEALEACPDTIMQETARGIHIFFKYDERLKNSAGRMEGIDIRSKGGYIIAAPSIHRTGVRYEIHDLELEPAAIPDAWVERLLRRKTKTAAVGRKRQVGVGSKTAYGKALKILKKAPEGERNNALNAAAFQAGLLVARGKMEEEDAKAELLATTTLSVDEASRTIESGLRAGQEKLDEERAEHAGFKLLRGDRAQPLVCDVNVLIYARKHLKLQFDSRSRKVEWRESPPWRVVEAGGAVEEIDYHVFATFLGEYEEYACSVWHAEMAIYKVAQETSYDPVVDYLRALKWDGVARLDNWLATYAHADNDVITQQMASKWCISAVARALKPGCQADYMLVLQGPQGCGKSRLIHALSAWTKAPHIDLNSKDAEGAMKGVWIVEIPEMGSIRSGSNQERIKAFITCTCDSYRPPYERHVIDRPRSCVMAGTTNDTNFLKDPTGSRRFWIVQVGPKLLQFEQLAAERDQLWAEAVVRYQAGERWWLGEQEEQAVRLKLKAISDELNADPWEANIVKYLEGKDWISAPGMISPAERNWTTTNELLKLAIGLNVSAQDCKHHKRVVGILKRLGYQCARTRECNRWQKIE